jgi:Ca2+-transporting ATPase
VRWHRLDAAEAAELLGSDPARGIGEAEAEARLRRYGHNRFREEKPAHPLALLLRQFRDFMVYVLIAAAAVSGFLLGELLDAAVIMFIVVANAGLGFVQEYRAEKALESLRRLSAPTARVVRGGRERVIPARDLVPGDLILLEAGDRVAADARVLQAHGLQADEASLTGESTGMDKTAAALPGEDIPIGDRTNMVFAGTHIVHGRGSALVVETGRYSELGRIAEMIGEAEEERTPLQRELAGTGKRIALLCLATCAVIFLLNLWRGHEWSEVFLFSVSLAVAAIPEGLPAIVTVAMALGVRRMAERNALLRRLPAVETLGCADVICTDKTGTLTLNRMEVREIHPPYGRAVEMEDLREGDEALRAAAWPVLATAVLCNDAREQEGEFMGEATEAGLLRAARDLAFPREEVVRLLPRREEIPFESERKMMSTVHAVEEPGAAALFLPPPLPRYILLAKGAPEAILRRCNRVLTPGGIRDLSGEQRARFMEEAEAMARRSLRTLAFAFRPLPDMEGERPPGELESDLVYLGMVGMMDPPRPEVREALEKCRRAHVRVVMITGDHAATARAIAEELGILSPGKELVSGEELARMSDGELAERVERIAVYARVSPADKVKIVRAWKAKGRTVAMTGDGVNDAPALKNADIGVAMGITGTDVSKEASDMVLADDNFATIVGAVEQGRIIYDNLKKFIYFLLSCNMSEVVTMFLGMLVTSVSPLRAVQVLWMNLVTDGLPAMALGVDTPAPDVMSRPPRDPAQGILAWRKQVHVILQGAILASGALAAFFVSRYVLFPTRLDVTQTVVFTTLVFSQLLHAFNARSETLTFGEMSHADNKALIAALLVSAAMQLLVVLFPPFMRLFGTARMNGAAWGLVVACSLLPVVLADRLKLLLRRRIA